MTDLQAALVELHPLGVQPGHPTLLVVGQQAPTPVMPPAPALAPLTCIGEMLRFCLCKFAQT